jgi:hypothetical protein
MGQIYRKNHSLLKGDDNGEKDVESNKEHY